MKKFFQSIRLSPGGYLAIAGLAILLALFFVFYNPFRTHAGGGSVSLNLYVYPTSTLYRNPSFPTSGMIPAGCSTEPSGSAYANNNLQCAVWSASDYRIVSNVSGGTLYLTNENNGQNNQLGSISLPFEGSFSSNSGNPGILWSIYISSGGVQSSKVYFYVLDQTSASQSQISNFCSIGPSNQPSVPACYLGVCYICSSGATPPNSQCAAQSNNNLCSNLNYCKSNPIQE